MMDDNAAPTPM
jgi:hypothetical protein